MLSYPSNIGRILEITDKIKPREVADIGAGFGKFGLLLREQYLSRKAEQGELNPIDDFHIMAVEDTKYFLTYRLSSIYNYVLSESVFDSYWKIGNKDLILMIDVVEHWDKAKAKELIYELRKLAPVLISTPKETTMYQEHFYGDARHHISQWEREDFEGGEDYSSDKSHIFLMPKL